MLPSRIPPRPLHASPLRRTLLLPALPPLPLALTTHAQTPVVEAANSSDETVLQVFDDGGLLVSEPSGTGTIPTEGAGARLMWYPEKRAFRAGGVFAGSIGSYTFTGEEWDDANIGYYSVGMGYSTTASGHSAVALGYGTTASGGSAVALGNLSTAEGGQSVAIGDEAQTSDRYAIALGSQAKATSYAGIAIGWKASTGIISQGGMVLNAVYTASGDGPTLLSTGQFAANARHFWFGDDATVTHNSSHLISTSTGAYLTDTGVWTNVADSTKKEFYRPGDGEALLDALREIPVRTWSYKDEPDSVRHMGPTAQDFYAAFGLGTSDKAIGTVDIDGVNMRAIQALDARTQTLRQENETLRATVAALEQRVEALESQHGNRALAGLGYAPVMLASLVLLGGLMLWRRREHAA